MQVLLQSCAQFLCNVPQTEPGLQSAFVRAGREHSAAIKKLRKNSLSLVVVDLVRHVRKHATDGTVGDLGLFVDILARFSDRRVHECSGKMGAGAKLIHYWQTRLKNKARQSLICKLSASNLLVISATAGAHWCNRMQRSCCLLSSADFGKNPGRSWLQHFLGSASLR